MLSENRTSPTPAPPDAPLPAPAPIPFWDTFAFGTFCGLLSALAYLAANTCLRSLTRCDPVWVSAIKAVPTVLLTGPWLIVRARYGLPVMPSWRALFALFCAGLVGQLGGNITFQWSLGVIGLALVVPLCLAAQIMGAAALGRIFLGEPITFRTAGAVCLLVLATAILSLGANDAYLAVTKEWGAQPSTTLLVLGVLGALWAGLSYAILGVIIRRNLKGDVSVATSLFTICLEGTILLGAIGIYRIGIDGVLAIAPSDHAVMFLGGVFNAVAFLSLTKALHLVPVVYANALGATQTALAAVAGVMMFAEPLSPTMAIGVALTVVGVLMMRGKKKDA